MSERKEKKIRRLQRRIEELEGENKRLRSMMIHTPTPNWHDWLYKPYSQLDNVGPDGKIYIKPDIAASLDYINNPLDAHYTPIPSGHKPGFFQRLKSLLFG